MNSIQKLAVAYFLSSTLIIVFGINLILCLTQITLLALLILLIMVGIIFGLGVRKLILLRTARLMTESKLLQISPIILMKDGNHEHVLESQIIVFCFGVLFVSHAYRY